MGFIKSLLKTFLKYFGTVDQRRRESKPVPFMALLNLIPKLIDFFF